MILSAMSTIASTTFVDPHPLDTVLGSLFWIGVGGWGWRWWRKRKPSGGSVFVSRGQFPPVTPLDHELQAQRAGVRTVEVPVPFDPADHPYTPATLDTLMTHLYESHFEVWNSLGERSPSPQTWRREHAADHNQHV